MKNPFKVVSSAEPEALLQPGEPVAVAAGPADAIGLTGRSAAPSRATRPAGSVGGGSAHVFASPLNHVKPFLAAAWHNFTLVAPVLLVVAVVLAIMAATQAATFITAFSDKAKSSEINRLAPVVDKKPLVGPDYQSAANVIAKNNSAVQVALSKNRGAIVLSIKDPALLPEFMYALVTIQSYRPGVAWTAGLLCLNKCEGSNAALAEITGYTQSISFSGLRSN